MGLYIRFKGYIYRKHIYTVKGNGFATTLPLEVFTGRNFIAEFIRFLFAKMTHILFEPPFGRLRGNVRTTSIARWKERGRLPIRYNCAFVASSYG